MPSVGHAVGLEVAVLTLIVLRVHFSVPDVKPSTAPPDEFSEARTVHRLRDIVNCGIRMVGSEANEVCAPNIIWHQLGGLVDEAASLGREVEVQTQHATGAFFLDFIGGVVNTYENVTNIIARTSGGDSSFFSSCQACCRTTLCQLQSLDPQSVTERG